MGGPWEKFQEAPAGPWSKFQEAPAAPALDFQPTDYGFKAAKGEAPTGGPAIIREDGAINFPGQSHWLFYDAKTKQYAPAPSEPWANKGFLSRNLGADALAENGRNFGIGTERAVNAGLALAQRAIPNSWQPADQAQTDQSAQMTNAQRIAAINATQRESAKKYQDFGQMAPAMAVSSLAPTVGASFLGRALPGALTFGTASGVTTEGDLGERAKAAGVGTLATLAGQGVLEKGVPLIGKGIGAVTSRLSGLGKTPAAQELLDTLGAKLNGKLPGEALQDAAHAKYNAAWDEFKQAVAPVNAEASQTPVDYTQTIGKLKDVLGVGKQRSPMPMDKEAKETLSELLANLEETQKPGGMVDTSFSGAIDTIKNLGGIQRKLAKSHGSTVAREMVGDIRDSVLQSMQDSNPALAKAAEDARGVFKTKVVPLFDKSEGGNYLTQVRDSATPGDLLASGNQGSLARMKPDKAAIVAKGSSADPMLYSYLDAAIKQANGNPGVFAGSLKKAMPAVEAIADPDTLSAFQGLVKVADTSKFTGWLANTAGGYLAGGGLGAVAGTAATISPKFTGPGLVWKLLQSPSTRKLLTFAEKIPAGSPELELIAKELSATAGKVGAGSVIPSNVTPLQNLPKAAGEGTPDIAQK